MDVHYRRLYARGHRTSVLHEVMPTTPASERTVFDIEEYITTVIIAATTNNKFV